MATGAEMANDNGNGGMMERFISIGELRAWLNEHQAKLSYPMRGNVYSYLLDAPITDAFMEADGGLRFPIGKDGEPVRPGDTVFGEDREAWRVIGIGTGHHKIIAVKEGQHQTRGYFKRLRAEWVTHRKPARTPEGIAKVMEMFADGGMTADAETLRCWAEELREAK